MTSIPEYWEYESVCSFTLRSQLKTETYNKCLVCSKSLANDNTELSRHWIKYNSENITNHSQNIQTATFRDLGMRTIKNPSSFDY